MSDLLQQPKDVSSETQCQFFVVRKKRLCRMTVKPGRQYCGEHEPQPKTADGQDDSRIPCPNDPKHTCYVSKLEKHLLICNARPTEQPPYIVYNINSPMETEVYVRKPLNQLSKETIMAVIEKVNTLYDRHVKDKIVTEPELPIHSAVLQEFSERDRTESSLRHLRQVSSLLWLAEREGLVGDDTCYVEMGAGKGHLSYHVCRAWCAGGASSALLLERAALRHKRDNAVAGAGPALRVRADLAHVALARVPAVARAAALVALAKHLCGAATDLALRGVAGEAGARRKARGALLATCCHHRCARAPYVGGQHLQELGISGDDFNVMLGIVSWATCGDGRSRQLKNQTHPAKHPSHADTSESNEKTTGDVPGNAEEVQVGRVALAQEEREEVGRRAKQLIDWGRVLYLRECGFDARLCYFVPAKVSPENELGISGDDFNVMLGIVSWATCGDGRSRQLKNQTHPAKHPSHADTSESNEKTTGDVPGNAEEVQVGRVALAQEEREEVGRRAKQLIDWGRVLYLRECGFDARLCYFVPAKVSPENVCIVAKKYI